jgi:hypothetical protein
MQRQKRVEVGIVIIIVRIRIMTRDLAKEEELEGRSEGVDSTTLTINENRLY